MSDQLARGASDTEVAACEFCGEPAVEDLFDAYSDHNFQIEACCPARHELLAQSLAEDTQFARQFFEQAGLTGLRRAADTGTALIADYCLTIKPVAQRIAKAFVQQHHRHCSKPPPGWLFGAACFNSATMIGVAFIGRPTSRHLDNGSCAEVTRLCLDLGLPDALRWNAASQLYGWAAREAKRRGYGRIVTYLRDDESGVSLKAAGWQLEAHSKGGDWARRGRPRDSQNTGPKSRWARDL